MSRHHLDCPTRCQFRQPRRYADIPMFVHDQGDLWLLIEPSFTTIGNQITKNICQDHHGRCKTPKNHKHIMYLTWFTLTINAQTGRPIDTIDTQWLVLNQCGCP